MTRPYTGYDTNSRGPLPGTVALRDLILFLNAGKLTHLGTYAKQRGLVTMFPSYTLHRVKPVTQGTRYSLVAWVSGPPFK